MIAIAGRVGDDDLLDQVCRLLEIPAIHRMLCIVTNHLVGDALLLLQTPQQSLHLFVALRLRQQKQQLLERQRIAAA